MDLLVVQGYALALWKNRKFLPVVTVPLCDLECVQS